MLKKKCLLKYKSVMQIPEIKKNSLNPLQIIQTFTDTVGNKISEKQSLFRSESLEFVQQDYRTKSRSLTNNENQNKCKLITTKNYNNNAYNNNDKAITTDTFNEENCLLLENYNQNIGKRCKSHSLDKNSRFQNANKISSIKYSTSILTLTSNNNEISIPQIIQYNKSDNLIETDKTEFNSKTNKFINNDIAFTKKLLLNNNNDNSLNIFTKHIKKCQDHILIQDLDKFCSSDIGENKLITNFQKGHYNADTDILM